MAISASSQSGNRCQFLGMKTISGNAWVFLGMNISDNRQPFLTMDSPFWERTAISNNSWPFLAMDSLSGNGQPFLRIEDHF